MTYGESLGADGRGLFKMAALTFFVELQKKGDFLNPYTDMEHASLRAEIFVKGIDKALSAEVTDDAQKEGGSHE